MPRSAGWEDADETLDRAGLRHSACLPNAEPKPSASRLKRVLFLPISHSFYNSAKATYESLTTRFIKPPRTPSDFWFA